MLEQKEIEVLSLLQINPTQLRIADIIMKASIDKVDEGLGYECAKMDMGEIKVSK